MMKAVDILNRIRGVKADVLSGTLVTLDGDHSYVHEGKGFKAHLNVATLEATATELVFSTNSKIVHLKNIKLSGIGGSAKATIIRGTEANPLDVTPAATVTGLTGANNLKDGADASAVGIKNLTSYNDSKVGEVWDFVEMKATATNQAISASDSKIFDNEELMLLPNTDYVMKLERIGTDSPTNVTLSLFWYEI